MRIKNDIEIKPYEWLYIMAALILVMLIMRGDMQTAIEALTKWLPKPK
jgi:hypothetical protein